MQPSGASHQPSPRTDLAWLVVVAVAYYVTAQLSLQLSLIEDNVTPLWPPTGVAVVAFLLGGRRMWPAVAVAAFVLNAPISESILGAAVTAVGNTVAPALAAAVLERVGFRRDLDRLRDAVAIVAVALACMVVSATIGAVALVATGAIEGGRFAAAWAVWWAGDAMGVLVVTPFLLTARGLHRLVDGWRNAIEAVVLGLALIASSVAATMSDLPLLFVVLPVLGWAAWRFQQAGAAPATLLVCGVAAYAAARSWGPFASGSLLARMVTLQAFNASVSLASFVFAALVAERTAQHTALERAVHDLEGRVQASVDELAGHEERLAEAEAAGQIGSWGWDLRSQHVTWSDQMFRIHGHEPGSFEVTFDRAVAQVVPEDAARIRANVEEAIRRGGPDVPAIEYRIRRPDGAERLLRGSGTLQLEDGRPVAMLGLVQDLTERRRAERDRLVAETLQRALLPQELPPIEGVALGAQYVPSERNVSAGGDWYDAVPLGDGRIACVIGDVAGRGLRAAAAMAQLRMAIRALALEGADPGRIATAVNQLLTRALERDMATMLYLEIDPGSGHVVLVNAGHPPALVVHAGTATFLSGRSNIPLGVEPGATYLAEGSEVPPGSTLVLFTDGLIDQPGVPIAEALERARTTVERHADREPAEIARALREALVDAEPPDDVAILVVRMPAIRRGALRLDVRAHPAELASVRARLRRWLEDAGVDDAVLEDLVLAANEAAANAIVHAYGAADGDVRVEAAVEDGRIRITVADGGTWREDLRRGGAGQGLRLIRACTDEMEIVRAPTGTELRLTRAVDGAGS